MASIDVKLSLLVLSLLIIVVLSVGQPRFKIDSRIVGGHDAIKGHFPYYVLLYMNSTTSNGFCGGAIISDKHILTAAHCFNSSENMHLNPKNIIAIFGITQLDTDVTIAEIESVSIHNKFKPEKFINDIALLKTIRTIEFSELIKPIPMAQCNIVATKRHAGTLCGFGWIDMVSNRLTRTFLQMNFCSKKDCLYISTHFSY